MVSNGLAFAWGSAQTQNSKDPLAPVSKKPIVIRGAGITGLWQALTLRRRGHDVILIERSTEPFEGSCSAVAGAMLAPYCEEEASCPLIRQLSLRSIDLWREVYPKLTCAGSLVVTPPRDRRELDRFARLTQGHERLTADGLGALEPDLADRFSLALYYQAEAHLEPPAALSFLLKEVQAAGVDVHFGTEDVPKAYDRLIDCRGLDARDELDDLRGVRGERVIIRTQDVELKRPVRLLHPRFPIYVVPWSDHRFMVGATQIESEAMSGLSVRSALELLSTAYALHPAFGDAEIVNVDVGLRPAFSDNLPRIVVKGADIYVNGLYRHGFILAPALAELVADHLASGAEHPEVFVADSRER